MRGKPLDLPSARGRFRDLMTYESSMKVAVAIVPAVVLYVGYDLNENLIASSLALTTMMSPLAIHSHRKPTPQDSEDKRVYLLKWSRSKLDGLVLDGAAAAVIWTVFWLGVLPSQETVAAWMERYRLTSNVPIESHLIIPTELWVTTFAMLCFRTYILFNSKWYWMVLGYFSGIVTLIYVYNLTFRLSLNSDNWKTGAVTGFVGGLTWALFTDYQKSKTELLSIELQGGNQAEEVKVSHWLLSGWR